MADRRSFLAALGACCLLRGFTYTVTDAAGRPVVHEASSLFQT